MKIDIKFSAWYERGTNHIQYYVADGKITNLMNVRIEKASIILFLYTKDQKVTDEISFDFYSIPAMGTESFSEKNVPVKKGFDLGDVYLDITKTVIVYEKGVIIETPVAYTFAVTRTYTYMTTHTTTLTLSEVEVFFRSIGGVLLLLVTAAVIAIVVLTRRKRHGPEMKAEMPTKPSTKTCVKCGHQLPVDAEYCSECGQKQT